MAGVEPMQLYAALKIRFTRALHLEGKERQIISACKCHFRVFEPRKWRSEVVAIVQNNLALKNNARVQMGTVKPQPYAAWKWLIFWEGKRSPFLGECEDEGAVFATRVTIRGCLFAKQMCLGAV